jgi:hypothetical protein
MRGTKDSEDIVAAARAHIASLPTHLKDRYSAKLICKLIAKVLLLEELREQDGAVIGLQLREYQKMKDRCVNGDTLTDAERDAIEFFAAIHNEGYGLFSTHTDTLYKLLERTKCPS